MKNEQAARAYNNRRLQFELDDGMEDVDERVPFLCECGDEACIETIRLDLDEYEAVRASPHRFVMIPGHQDGIGEVTVQGNGRFVVVERSAFREQAASHDPRRRDG